MRHEISIRAREGQPPLTTEQMRQVAPALFAPAPHESRSDHYVYVSTTDVMGALTREGFLPVEVRQSRCRDVSKRDFTKHMVRFRKGDAVPATDRRVGDVSFEVILRNAHDGTAAYSFMAGLFRLACLNGMVIPTGTIAEVHVRHSGNRQAILDQVVEGAYAVLGSAPLALEAPTKWSGIELTRDERMAFAESAHHVRFADADGNVSTPIKPEQVLISRRHADTGNDLWRTFNTVQENVLRGGLSGMGRDANQRPRRTTTRAVQGIDQDVKLNRALWTLAEKMAALKTA